MCKPIKCSSLLISLILLSGYAHAASMRCSSALVTSGDPTSEVLQKCGEPISRDFLGYIEVRDAWGYSQELEVEEWSYGPTNGMYHYLRFEGGRLKRVKSARRR
ncbi:conserved exported protein of unknown function [Pseudomonas marincola]|jgi:hypothetical protein|uniref:DUF2845 domain-containing protein n=1 Tax=Pseudomonas marincola TaxID=437900 RepID=A0A1I7E3P1_9PSED|nr:MULTISPECIES: DUF2845 domain-containing protein [Pseudomonas]OEO27019.1 hypothetical protein AX279_01670 [Pseudomonas sp. J237]CAE6940992.1 conserved exported protein of unknown function [Pseudomonas marincola]SFU18544.1 Protein of unknown function [Pseudomonas marincola]